MSNWRVRGTVNDTQPDRQHFLPGTGICKNTMRK